MQRIQINPMQGMSAYKLSHIVSHLVFLKPSLRYPNRKDTIKGAVLRALCDRYPNIWPSVEDIAAKANCGTTPARNSLRELEFKDRLIVDISTHPGKKGGRGKESMPQYFVRDRKIFDIYYQQKAWEKWDKTHPAEQLETQRGECKKPNGGSTINPTGGESKGNAGSDETQLGELGIFENPTRGVAFSPLNPTRGVAEPISIVTDQKNQPTILTNQAGGLEGGGALAKDGGHGKNIISRFMERYAARFGKILNLNSKNREGISALAAEIGDTKAEDIWTVWFEAHDRPQELNYPVSKFIEEAPSMAIICQKRLEDVQAEADRKAGISENNRRAQKSVILKDGWVSRLEMVESVDELDRFLQTDPAPPWLVEDGEQLRRLEYADTEIDELRRKLAKPQMVMATADIF